MDETEFNVDLAEKYLLGELDEEARLDFEVEVFTEEDSAEEFEAVRYDLVGQYLAGELTGERRQRFENYFLSSPYNMEVFLSERALFDAAKELKKEEQQEGEKVGFLAWLQDLLTLRVAIPAFALAMILALGVTAVVLVRNGSFEPVASGFKPPQIAIPNTNSQVNDPPKDENSNADDNTGVNGNTQNRDPNETKENINRSIPQPSEGPVFAMVFFSKGAKSGEKEVVLNIGKTTKSAVLRFAVPKENPGQDFARYEVTIENSANAEVWRREFVNERRPELVKEYKEAPSKFPAGNYVFRLIGISASGERETVIRTAFRAVRTEK